MTRIVAFLSGVVFAVGLCLAGMTQPAKVLAFLDVTGAWDPSLAVVMAAAVSTFGAAFRFGARGRSQALLGSPFPKLPSRIEPPLLIGAALFGLGWGMSGYCPGPAIIAATSTPAAAMALLGMVAGAFVTKRLRTWLVRPGGFFSRVAGDSPTVGLSSGS
jgi:uncharacterized membrane protein YedE/YeeE